MGSIFDFGGEADALNAPALGGPAGWAAAVTQVLSELVPIGTVVGFGGTTAPPGWALCDGSEHGVPALESVIGSATTPDLRDRFVVAAGPANPRGSTGGAVSVALTVDQMPHHNHSMDTESADHAHSGHTAGQDQDHSHHMAGSPQFQGWDIAVGPFGGHGTNNPPGNTFGASNSHGHAFTTGGRNAVHVHGIHGTGGGAAHENRPPFYALTYIIFTGATLTMVVQEAPRVKIEKPPPGTALIRRPRRKVW